MAVKYDSKFIRRCDYSVQKGAPTLSVANLTAAGMDGSRAEAKAKATWANHKLQGSTAEFLLCHCNNGVVLILYGNTGTSGAKQVTVLQDVAFGTGGS